MFLIFSLLYNLPFSRGATWETRIEIVVDLGMPHLYVPIRFASERNAYLRKIFGSYNAFLLQAKCKGWKGVMDNLWSFSFGSPNSMVSCHRLVWFLVYCTNFCHFFYKWRAAWKSLICQFPLHPNEMWISARRSEVTMHSCLKSNARIKEGLVNFSH